MTANNLETRVGRNERSWAIDLISYINGFIRDKDLAIKHAGGESTISDRGNTMFPDVILYGNMEQSIILQGWELKMPDVPIEDSAFIADAQRKARALNLNSCLIWNFTYAVLYLRDEADHFQIVKQWDETSFIRNRQDVQTYRSKWESLLEKIIIEVNGYFISGEFRETLIGDAISKITVSSLVQRNKDMVADKLKAAAIYDAVQEAYLDNWWSSVHIEYEHDETDKFKAYSKTIILNWAIRILFSHVIKTRQNAAFRINEISFDTTPEEANAIFADISSKCDFFNVFLPYRYDELMPSLTWHDLIELSLFLQENGIERLDQLTLQSILEDSVNSLKRQVNGQFATPPELAYILARITVRDWGDNVLDCCCGTGTIAKAAYNIKKQKIGVKSALESVWASDKNKYPLQAANISMADSDTINLVSRVFQHNALSLSADEEIQFTDPQTGSLVSYKLPLFGAIVSNLPFVPFEKIPDEDYKLLPSVPHHELLDGRSDLYCYISLSVSRILKPKGILGIITSNSWLGTKAGSSFIDALLKEYVVRQVHLCGRGRWFRNANIVTTILILQKRPTNAAEETRFFLWRKTLKEIEDNKEFESTLINSALLEQELDCSVVSVSAYSREKLNELISLNVSYNALFHKTDWLLSIKDKLIPIEKVFTVIRGSRRGWDALFYPREGTHRIDTCYLKRVLINAKKVNRLVTSANADAFCCSDSIATLREKKAEGTIEWIERFQGQCNEVRKPLPEVLKKPNMYWYEMKESEIADIVTTMNPGQRLFFALLDKPTFINQRLIGLTHKDSFPDIELNHALLNSMLTMFYIEASGFGRGLGALDYSKERIKKCYMLNPALISNEQRELIVSAFSELKTRDVKKTSEELFEMDRVRFEHVVLQSFGIDHLFEDIRQSLLSMQKTRLLVKAVD